MEILPRSAWTTLPNRWATSTRGPLDPAEVFAMAAHWPGTPVTSYAGRTQEQIAAVIRGFDEYHRNVRGWAGIGYCYLIDWAGRVWTGAGDFVAAHSATALYPRGNEYLMGVQLILGTDDELTPAMIAAWHALRAAKLPTFPKMTGTTAHQLVPGASTTCPGPAAMAAYRAGALHYGARTPHTTTTTTTKGHPTMRVIRGADSPKVFVTDGMTRRHLLTDGGELADMLRITGQSAPDVIGQWSADRIPDAAPALTAGQIRDVVAAAVSGGLATVVDVDESAIADRITSALVAGLAVTGTLTATGGA